MRSLYQARAKTLVSAGLPTTEHWGEIYKVIALNTSLVDRCGWLVQPFRLQLRETFKLPKFDSDFNMSYDECCRIAAIDLLEHSNKLNKPITVMYSGGIDSTCMLVSFLREIGSRYSMDQVRVALTIDSIAENPKFYKDHIRGKLDIVSSENISEMLDGSTIVAGGELNDQILGSDLLGKVNREMGSFDAVIEPYTQKYVTEFFQAKGMSSESSDVWYSVLNEHAQKFAPIKPRTLFDFFWWYNFIFKWQSVYIRLLTCVLEKDKYKFNEDFVQQNLVHFFANENFQQWSMRSNHLKIRSNWKSYKNIAKQVIYDYTRDLDYYENKVKVGSLYTILRQRDRADAILSDFKLLWPHEFNPEEFFIKDHHFV